MSIKKKILGVLDVSLDEITEHRLLDILIDAYHAKQKRINELAGANAREREDIHLQREQMAQEHRRMRTDPLYCASGTYLFEYDHRTQVQVDVQGFRVTAVKRADGIFHVLQPAPALDRRTP